MKPLTYSRGNNPPKITFIEFENKENCIGHVLLAVDPQNHKISQGAVSNGSASVNL